MPGFRLHARTTPATLGHYCLPLLLEPPDDSNWQNNLGQRNTDVTQAHSPAVFTSQLGNRIGPRTAEVKPGTLPRLANRLGQSTIAA